MPSRSSRVPDPIESPRPSRIAALDLGKVRIGLAVSDELRLTAQPRPPLDGRQRSAAIAALRALSQDENIVRFLVGFPLELNGEQGPAARRAIRFAQHVADATGREVELVDERLSSVEAERRLREAGRETRRKQVAAIDGAAAAVLLQAWLDRRSGL